MIVYAVLKPEHPAVFFFNMDQAMSAAENWGADYSVLELVTRRVVREGAAHEELQRAATYDAAN